MSGATGARPKRPLTRSQDRPQEVEPWRKLLECGHDSHKLTVKEIAGKGRGVITTACFAQNEYVAEYHGDLLDQKEAKIRWNEYSTKPSVGSFMYYFEHQSKKYCIDATHSTRLGRLINHGFEGQDANVRARVVMVKKKPTLVFFSLKEIGPGEEILYEYGDKSSASVKAFPFLKKKTMIRPRLLPQTVHGPSTSSQDTNSTDGASTLLGNLTLPDLKEEARIQGKTVRVSLDRVPQYVIDGATLCVSSYMQGSAQNPSRTKVEGPSWTQVPDPSYIQSPHPSQPCPPRVGMTNVAGLSQKQLPDPAHILSHSSQQRVSTAAGVSVAGPSRTQLQLLDTAHRAGVSGPSRTQLPDPVHSAYACPLCSRTYGSKGTLARHYRFDHKIRILPPEIADLDPAPRSASQCDWCGATIIDVSRHKAESCPKRHMHPEWRRKRH